MFRSHLGFLMLSKLFQYEVVFSCLGHHYCSGDEQNICCYSRYRALQSLLRTFEGRQWLLTIITPPLLPPWLKSLFASGIPQVSLWRKVNLTHHWVSAINCSVTLQEQNRISSMLSRNQRSQKDLTTTTTTKNDSQKYILQVFSFAKIII